MPVRRLLRWLPLAVVAALLLYGWIRWEWTDGSPGTWRPPAADGQALRIATWNLENFPHDGQDRHRIAQELEVLNADVLALQEIRDDDAVSELLPGFEIHSSDGGGRGHQRLAIAFDPHRLELVEPVREHDRLTLGGRVRPALVARMRPRGGGPDFVVIAVHLKAKPDGLAQRRTQWGELAALVADLEHDTVFVMGDFNPTGAKGGSPRQERRELGEALAPVGLRPIPVVGGCTAYWQGARHDGWLEPSWLDMVWASRHVGVRSSQAGGACARHACRPLRSTAAYPDPDIGRASDHCPVWFDVAMGEVR